MSGVPTIETYFGYLDVPVAELTPQEIVDLPPRLTELIGINEAGDIDYQPIVTAHNPMIGQGERSHIPRAPAEGETVAQIVHHKAGRVPYLVGEIAIGLHP